MSSPGLCRSSLAPVLERMQVSIDYGNKRMKWPHGQWIDIPVGPRGEHQLHLAEDVDELKDAEDEEILIPENAINTLTFRRTWA